MTIISDGESVVWTKYLTARKTKRKKWAGDGAQEGQLTDNESPDRMAFYTSEKKGGNN